MRKHQKKENDPNQQQRQKGSDKMQRETSAYSETAFVSIPNEPTNTDQESLSSEQILDAFYLTRSSIQAHIREIQSGAVVLATKHAEKMQTADMNKATAIGQEIATVTTSINTATKNVKDALDQMKKGIEKLNATQESRESNAGVIKIQENVQAHLVKTFLEVVNNYQKLQGENEKQYRDQTERRIKMRYTNEDGSTIDDARARELAQEAIEQGTENAIFQQSKDTLQMIIENRNDIYRIEQSMRELNQLFNDLAVLVSFQGEAIDSILSQVKLANVYVEGGRRALSDAKKYQKKSRKKFCIIICCVGIVVGFILAIALGFSLSR